MQVGCSKSRLSELSRLITRQPGRECKLGNGKTCLILRDAGAMLILTAEVKIQGGMPAGASDETVT